MNEEVKNEIIRLKEKGLTNICVEGELEQIAELTVEINRLKKLKNAVILAHVYQRPEVILGISDLVGDSFKLSRDCSGIKADIILFCGVNFMAQTAKILNPDRRVFVPSPDAGCSLSDSIKKEDVIALRKKYPDAPVVTYINTEAEVKAYSDVIVTSSNAEKILSNLYKKNKRIIFIPDKFMGRNIARSLNKRIGDEMILWDGSCIVHEKFDVSVIKEYRKKYPNMMVMAHSECPSEIIENVDFMGSTSDMLAQIKNTSAGSYMLVTECGLGELATTTFPDKKFIAMCRLCPYMKMTSLENVLETLKNLPSNNEVILSKDLIERSRKSIDMMFELAR
jgi:quinolinate synthase